MKVKVLTKFRDRHTSEIHKVDKVMDISEERYAEILEVGNFVEKVEGVETSTEKTEKPKKRTTKKAE